MRPLRWWRPALLILVAAAPLHAQDGSTRPSRPTLRAGRLVGPIHLDGLLSEPAWAAADSITDLIQVEPAQGGRPSGRTVVKVLADAGTLLIGVVAYDPEPSGIVSQSRAPDSELDQEDHIRLVLDPFLDGRSGYVFAVNPGGARVDALVAREGEDLNTDWDAVWEARTTRLAAPQLLAAPGSPAAPAPAPGGWSAEIRIPIHSLAFRPGLDAWGFNIERRIQRRLEVDRWANPLRDYGIGVVSRAGLLAGLPRFDLGVGLSIRPAFTGGLDVPGPGAGATGTSHPSLDVGQRIGSNLLASVTLNTDFAETDVDTRQANLSRFPLFFPEKRGFFLEGADIFDFGLGLEGETLLPFFSRRIGLLQGQQVPITAGAKLNGRLGRTGLGALVVRTGETWLGDGSAAATRVAPAGMGVVRLRQSLLAESSAGVLATFGDPLGRAGAWTAGADATYHTTRLAGDRNFLFGVWGLATGRNALTGDLAARSAAGFKLDYPNDLWDVALTYRRVGESFDPSLGFVPRSGIHAASLHTTYAPRPGGFIRQLFFENELSMVTDLGGRWESYELEVTPLNFEAESGEGVEFGVTAAGERLMQPFEVSQGVVIPAGAYRWPYWGGRAGLAAKRRLSGFVGYTWGGFYDGRLYNLEGAVLWRAADLFYLELEAQTAIARLPEGNFRADILGVTGAFNASPDLQLRSFVQYDNESRTIGANTRLRWTFSPYGTMFLVYNHNLQRTPLDRWGLESSQLLIKAQYTLRY